jgi:hypothetical protein
VENSSSPAFPLELAPGLEHGATFRFPITWSYLLDSKSPSVAIQTTPSAKASRPTAARTMEVVEAPAPTPAAVPVNNVVAVIPSAAPAVIPSASMPSKLAAKKPAEPRPVFGPDAKWEMVIPKMARPLAARVARPTRAIGETAKPAEAPTEVSFYTDSEASFVPRRWKVVGLSTAAVVVALVIVWVRPGSQATVGNGSAPSAAGTWSRRTAYVRGSSAPREILVFSGSDDLKNYRIEFSWVPEPRGVGWIFRATDSANYYAARLRLVQAGAIPTLSAEHFAVVKGVEGAHSRKVITLSRALREVAVRMDATGPAFTLFLQGNPSDYWTDERFESGSLGFYEEGGERPVVQGLRFTLFKKSGLQTVVTSLQ